MRKLRFFLIGFIPGLLLVFFILNKKGASCSGYLPNSRVVAETLTKDFRYSDNFKAEMAANNVSEKFLRDSILTEGEINFDQSKAQEKPCPKYKLYYPKKNSKYFIDFTKCDEGVTFDKLVRIR